MSLNELLKKLNRLNVKIWVEENQLRYKAAKGVLIPELKNEIISHKDEIIGFFKKANIGKITISSPIAPQNPKEKYALSISQQRLWFLYQLEPENPFYNLRDYFRLEGEFNLGVFQQAMEAMVERHTSLRTTFIVEKGTPYQVISKNTRLEIPLIDLTQYSAEKREKEAKRLTEEEAHKPFDLAKDLPLRVSILKLSQEDHVLLFTTHHIVSDEWSLGIFFKELISLYNAFLKGEKNPLKSLKLQYTDYTLWQRKQLEGEVLETQEKYWKDQFKGEIPILNLPTDKSRPKKMTHRGAGEDFKLTKELTEKLKRLSQENNATLFMTLLASFNLLLSRYSHQEDIVIGSPIANRHHQDTEDIIGFFVNTLALRTSSSGVLGGMYS